MPQDQGGGTVGGVKAFEEASSGGEKVRPPWMSGGRKTQTLKPLPPREARPASGPVQPSHPPKWIAGHPTVTPSPPPMPVPSAQMPMSGPSREAGPPELPKAMGSPVAPSTESKVGPSAPMAPPAATGMPRQGPPAAKIPQNFSFRELPVLDSGSEPPAVASPVVAPVSAPQPAKSSQGPVRSQAVVPPLPVVPPMAVAPPMPVAPPRPVGPPSAVPRGVMQPPMPGPLPAVVPPVAAAPIDTPVPAKTTEVVPGGGGAPRGVALAGNAPGASGVGPATGRKTPGGVGGGAALRKGIGLPIAGPQQQGAPAQGAAVAPASLAARRRGSRLWSSLFLLVLLGAGGVAAYFYWTQTRETRLVCQPMLDGYKISETAYLMNPLVAEVERLHQRYQEQLEPLRTEQARREQAVAAAEKAAKEAEAPVAAAKQALAALEMKHKQEAVGLNAQGQEQFEARFKALEAELANTRQSFQRAIADRAGRIKIEFAEDPAETEPDIVVSRFRTGLYGAGVGVDRKAEQAWAEEQLGQWRGYFEYWKSQRTKLQEEFRASQGQFGGILDKQKAEVEKARAAIAKTEQQLKVAQDAAEAARKAMGAGGFDPKSIEAELFAQMDALPEKFKLAESGARADGKFVFSKLDQNPNTPPQKYVVFFRAWNNEKEYWAFAEAEVVRLQEVVMRVFPESLMEKRRMLLEGKFEPE